MTSTNLKFPSKTIALWLSFAGVVGGLSSACGSVTSPKSNLESATNENVFRIGNAAIEAWGILLSNTCSYHTSSSADVDITIRDVSIVWGSKVYLLSGLTSVKPILPSFERIWDAKDEVEMKSISDFVWRARRSATMVERGRAVAYDTVSFVIKVISPMGDVRYIKPSSGDSYLNATFDLSTAECRRQGEEPVLKSMKLKAVKD
jgi:hypothetical protein